MSKSFERIKAGLEDAIACAGGDTAGRRLYHTDAPAVDVRAIRRRTGLTQDQFSAKYGFTLATLRNWEQGRRRPERAARLLLKVIEKYPGVVEKALEEAERK